MDHSVISVSPNRENCGDHDLEKVEQMMSDAVKKLESAEQMMAAVADAVKKLESAGDDSKLLRLADDLKELLISKPTQVSVQYGFHVKLWETCFYKYKIEPLRKRIFRHKKKKLTSGSNSEDESVFKSFLNYSIDFYTTMLSECKGSDQYSGKPQRNTAPRDGMCRHPSVVLLHYFYLRLGDLHRYNDDLIEAEKSYRQSAKLLPVSCAPYNQIGVIHSHKKMLLDALHFFACSLMSWEYCELQYIDKDATVKNMAHLFQITSKLLLDRRPSNEYQKWQSAPGKIDERVKNSVIEVLLAEFVDVHGRFFDFSTPAYAIIDNSKIVQLQDLANIFLEHLDYLLTEDQLDVNVLLKMIRINIFTVVNLDNCILGQKKDDTIIDVTISMDESDQIKVKSLPSIALNFAYRFGTVLVSQFKKAIINKKLEQDQYLGEMTSSASTQGLPYLMALQYFCDWVYGTDTASRLTNHNSTHCVSEQAASVAYTEQRNFNVSLASLWNGLHESNKYSSSLGEVLWNELNESNKYATPRGGEGVSQLGDEAGNLKFKEHFALRGFDPFFNFVSQESHTQLNLGGEAELHGRIHSLFHFLRACNGFDVDKDGRFQSQAETDDSEGYATDASTCPGTLFTDEAQPSICANTRNTDNDKVNAENSHQSPSSIGQKFRTHQMVDDFSETAISTDGFGVSTSAVNSHAPTFSNLHDLPSYANAPNALPFRRDLAPSSSMRDGSINIQYSSTSGGGCKNQGLLHVPQSLNKLFYRFRSAALSNPFEASPASVSAYEEESAHQGLNGSLEHGHRPLARDCTAEHHRQPPKIMLERFLSAASSNPFERQQQCPQTSNLTDLLHSKNISIPPIYSASLSKFVQHADPQSLLFDYHPELSMAERAARNAFILFGIHQQPGVNQERDIARKRSFPF